ncbi:MAG: hydrolase [Firmicutes bacterium]|nr:hydrolase [Bacillota bacterium]
MENFTEKLIEKQPVLEGRVLNVRVDRVLLPNGKEATREVVEHPGAVAVVPILDGSHVLMVRQYRYPVGKMLLEIPAGKLDIGEKPEDCARRELEEETGYVAGSLEKLTAIYTAPGFSNEIIHIYLAQNLCKTVQKLDDDEFLTVEKYSWPEIKEMLADGAIQDAKTIAGLLLARAK